MRVKRKKNVHTKYELYATVAVAARVVSVDMYHCQCTNICKYKFFFAFFFCLFVFSFYSQLKFVEFITFPHAADNLKIKFKTIKK